MGQGTFQKFIEAVRIHAAPAPDEAVGSWLASAGLKSSHFRALPEFCRFIGLLDDKGPTPVWNSLRDDASGGQALRDALTEAYSDVLKFLNLEAPGADQQDRLANRIRVTEKVSDAEAQQAASTIISAFDAALGRAPVAAPLARKPPVQPRGTAGRPKGAVKGGTDGEAGSGVNGRRGLDNVSASLAVNLQFVLPADATAEQYDLMLGAVARHLGPLLGVK